MFPLAAPRGKIEILGKQNELFPSGPVIKCLFLNFVKYTLTHKKHPDGAKNFKLDKRRLG